MLVTVAEGKTNAEITDDFHISLSTVKFHLGRSPLSPAQRQVFSHRGLPRLDLAIPPPQHNRAATIRCRIEAADGRT